MVENMEAGSVFQTFAVRVYCNEDSNRFVRVFATSTYVGENFKACSKIEVLT